MNAPARVAPTLLQDRVADPIAVIGPVGDALVVGAEHRREAHRAVERDPVHELRVEEVAGAAAHLPDALVDVDPAQRGAVGDVGEERAELGIDVDAERDDLRGGVEQLAVDVELGLVPRAVPDRAPGGCRGDR